MCNVVVNKKLIRCICTLQCLARCCLISTELQYLCLLGYSEILFILSVLISGCLALDILWSNLVISVDKVLASENWLKGSHIPSIWSPLVDEERMRPGHWLRLVICFLWWFDTHSWMTSQPIRSHSINAQRFFTGTGGRGGSEGKWQTPVHLEKRPFNGSTSSYQLVLILKCHWKDSSLIQPYLCWKETLNSN